MGGNSKNPSDVSNSMKVTVMKNERGSFVTKGVHGVWGSGKFAPHPKIAFAATDAYACGRRVAKADPRGVG